MTLEEITKELQWGGETAFRASWSGSVIARSRNGREEGESPSNSGELYQLNKTIKN
jgi:hypothetical protein